METTCVWSPQHHTQVNSLKGLIGLKFILVTLKFTEKKIRNKIVVICKFTAKRYGRKLTKRKYA